MALLPEADVQRTLLETLNDLGFQHVHESISGPDGTHPERAAYEDTILEARFEHAVARLNPGIPRDARAEAVKQVFAEGLPDLVEENRRLHGLLVNGVPVEYRAEDGTLRTGLVRLLDFDDAEANDWLVIDEFVVIDPQSKINRRADVVVFVNGLPLGVIELKAPGSEQATLHKAFTQLQTYKQQVPALFRTNAVLAITDGLTARLGSLTAGEDRFMPWRTTDGRDVAPKGEPEMLTLLEGVFQPERFLRLVRDFTVIGSTGSGVVKIVAGYHQFFAVQHAVQRTIEAAAPNGDRKVGVIWHTQGSGKSLLMAFYAGQLVRQPELENPTIVVITDRNDLDDQLFGTFSMAQDLIRQTPIQAQSREDLQTALNRASGGVVFTTIQKFAPTQGQDAYPVLSERRNIVVIADEAHRSQYGFGARLETNGRGEASVSYGFAKYLRDALPNASFIGFTGTPIEQDDVNTPAVFGHYVDVYDISRAIQDGATVPIYYESRLAKIDIPDDVKPELDEAIEELTENEESSQQEKLKARWSTIEAVVGSKARLELVARDLVEHFEARLAALDGKAMVVCMSRRICVALYDEIVKLRPDWHADSDHEGVVKVVMHGAASDPEAWQPHLGTKARRDLMAKRAKDPDDPLKLVLVRDMWLTGFDAPSMHTMYIDKPMRGHGLMQAIARVNRVFKDKPAGLIVDYIGIAQSLRSALRDYSPSDTENTGIDLDQAVRVLQEKFEITQAMFHGFPYKAGLAGSGKEKLTTLSEGVEWIARQQHERAAQAEGKQEKKRELRRYQDAVLALTKAYALASSSDYARTIRDDVGFFQAVRAQLVKTSAGGGAAGAEREFAVRQLIDRSVVTTGIEDLLAASGFASPDISVLSEEFLREVGKTEKKNLALTALEKLLRDQIRSRSQSNVVQSKRFSERLEDAINRYEANAVTTGQVLEELIKLAREMRDAMNRGEDEGLTPDEMAFYDALAQNDSAVEAMGIEELRVIASELLVSLKQNITVDWARRESVRAKLRVLVKRILRKHGYPPDLSSEAVKTVLQQAEVLSAQWSRGKRANV